VFDIQPALRGVLSEVARKTFDDYAGDADSDLAQGVI
jgi:hypothetical protein